MAPLQSHVMGRVLAGAIFVLLLLHLVVVFVLRISLDHDTVYGLAALFDFDDEANVPSWFSSALLVGGCVACLIAGKLSQSNDPRLARYWSVLAIALLFLSADEALRLHERLMAPIKGRGMFFFGWVLVYVPAVALFGLWMVRFLTLLPRRTAAAFLLSGSVYLSGAVGLELVGGSIAYGKLQTTIDRVGNEQYEVLRRDIPYQIAVTIEEVLEMIGLSIFLVSVLRHLESQRPN